jgi:hypothetical protein
MDRIEKPDPNTELAESLGLLRRLAMFLLPVFCVFAFGEYLMWKTGENWPIRRVAKFQQTSTEPVLFSRNLMSQQFGIYKLARLRLVQPKVLVVGSSRVMQFRATMFEPMHDSFYNAGGMVQSSEDLLEFAQLVEQHRVPAPEVLIIGVDPWWLKSKNETLQEHRLASLDEVFRFCAHAESLKSIANGIHTNKLREALSVRDQQGTVNAIGIAALTQGSGFREDGSWQYPLALRQSFLESPQFVDRERPTVLERIQDRKLQFSLPIACDDQQCEMLVRGMELLVKQGVEVWAFAPPLSSESLSAITGDREYRPLWKQYQQLFSELESRGVRVLNRSSLDELPDQFMIDGFHPGEVYSAELLVAMIALAPRESILHQIDIQRLKQLIDDAASPLLVDASL